jgi:hypothetical protein
MIRGTLEAAGTPLNRCYREGSRMSEHITNDFDKLKGIGPGTKDMLKSTGIDSIKE